MIYANADVYFAAVLRKCFYGQELIKNISLPVVCSFNICCSSFHFLNVTTTLRKLEIRMGKYVELRSKLTFRMLARLVHINPLPIMLVHIGNLNCFLMNIFTSSVHCFGSPFSHCNSPNSLNVLLISVIF